MTKIGVALPLYKNVPVEFFCNFINRLYEFIDEKMDMEILMEANTVIDQARNHLVKQAIKKGCDYLWFIDSDHIIEKGTIQKLLKTMEENKDVGLVSALYFTKSNPYLPVARIHKDGKDDILYNFDINKIQEVDGVGLGCCLIRMEVFNKIEFPWFLFEYRDWEGIKHHVSEDLSFCDKLRALGYKILLDTSLITGHIGSVADYNSYLITKKELLAFNEDKEELIESLAKFDNISRENAAGNIEKGLNMFKEEWLKANPKTQEDRIKFYSDSYWQKYDLTEWHLSDRRKFDLSLVEHFKSNFPDKSIFVLDFGCGIAENSYLLAKEGYKMVHLHDLNGKTLKFAKSRFLKDIMPVKVIYDIKNTKLKFDVILLFDVLEHLDDDEFFETVKLIERLKKKEGVVLLTASFGMQKEHPMHFNISEEKKKAIERLTKCQ